MTVDAEVQKLKRAIELCIDSLEFNDDTEEKRKGLAALHASLTLGVTVEEALAHITTAQWQYQERPEDARWLVYTYIVDRPITIVEVKFKIGDA